MNRREALAAGGLAGVALGTGCAPRMLVPGGFDAASALADLDRSLSETRSIASSVAGVPVTRAPDVPAEQFQAAVGRVSEICSEGARALMVAAWFHGLAANERLHPAIQTRMHEELPRIGGAVAAMAGAMEQLGPKERRAIQKHLRETPGLEDRIASEVDGHASRSDAPFGRRVQLRRQMGELGWRMRRQPVDVVIDEVVGKYRKAEAYQRAHADEILALARPPGAAPPEGPVLIGQALGGSPAAAVPETTAPAPGGSPATAAPVTSESPPAAAPAPRAPAKLDWWWVPGAITTLIGLGTLGLGVVAGTVASGTGNLGLATLALLVVAAGGLVLVIGLVVLLVGGLMSMSTNYPKPQPAPVAPAPGPSPVPVPERPPDPAPL